MILANEDMSRTAANFGADKHKRVSLSVLAFRELLDKAQAEGGQNNVLISRLEQRLWVNLYRQARSGRGSAELMRLLDGDRAMREQAPALYLTAAINAGRYQRRVQRWSWLGAVLASPWRWWMAHRLPVEPLGAPDVTCDAWEQLWQDPEFASRLAREVANGTTTKAKTKRTKQGTASPPAGTAAATATATASAGPAPEVVPKTGTP